MTCSRKTPVVGALVFVVASAARAQEPSLDRLAWLAGTWTGESDGVEMIEHWTDSKGGLMLGIHRDVKGGKAVLFEFLRIQAIPQGIVYFASPRGAPATPFPMVEMGEQSVVFANPKHDFPQRIIYRRTSDGSLFARVEGTVQGKPRFEEWTWKRGQP